MRKLLTSGCCALLLLAGFSEARSMHAWVEGNVHNDISGWHNVRHSWASRLDLEDNVRGLTFDAVDAQETAWGRLAGISDLATGALELLADSQSELTVRAVASLHDVYTFRREDSGAPGGDPPAVLMDISYRGALSDNSLLAIWVDGVQTRVITSDGEVSGIHTQRLEVKSGRGKEIHLRIEAAAWHGGTADFREGIRVTFRTADPRAEVLVISDGGYRSDWIAQPVQLASDAMK
jgi:hypothetical protein